MYRTKKCSCKKMWYGTVRKAQKRYITDALQMYLTFSSWSSVWGVIAGLRASGVFQVNIRCISGVFQVYFRCISGVFQVNFRCISGVFQVNVRMFFRCISGVFQVYFKPPLLSLLIGVGSYGRVKSFISQSILYCAVVMRTVWMYTFGNVHVWDVLKYKQSQTNTVLWCTYSSVLCGTSSSVTASYLTLTRSISRNRSTPISPPPFP